MSTMKKTPGFQQVSRQMAGSILVFRLINIGDKDEVTKDFVRIRLGRPLTSSHH